MAVFMERLYGHTAAGVIVMLIALAALASVFALLLGYSRIPFAAARDGNFPAWFGVLHPKHRIPMHSLLTLGGITLVCCIFRLQEVITTLVVVRILFQFLLQGTAALSAEASPGAEDTRISYAALSAAGTAGTGRLRLHSVFAAEFFARDADGGSHSDRGSDRVWASLSEDAEADIAGQAIQARTTSCEHLV